MIKLNESQVRPSIITYILSILGFTRQAQARTIDITLFHTISLNPIAILAAVNGLVRYITTTGKIADLRRSFREDTISGRILLAIFYPLLDFLWYYKKNANDQYRLTRFLFDNYFAERPGRKYPLLMHMLFNILSADRKLIIFGSLITISLDIKLNKDNVEKMLADNFLGDNVVRDWKLRNFRQIGALADLDLVIKNCPGFYYSTYDISRDVNSLESLANCIIVDGIGDTTNFLVLRNAIIDDFDRAHSILFASSLIINGIPGFDNPIGEFYQTVTVQGKSFIWNGQPLQLDEIDDNQSNIVSGTLSVQIVQHLAELVFGVGELTEFRNPIEPIVNGNNGSRPGKGKGPRSGGRNPQPKAPQGNGPLMEVQPMSDELSGEPNTYTNPKPQITKSQQQSRISKKLLTGGPKSFELKDVDELMLEVEDTLLKENKLSMGVQRANNLVNRLSGPLRIAANYLTAGNLNGAVSFLNQAITLYNSLRSTQQQVVTNTNYVQQNTLRLQANLEQKFGLINL